MHELNSRTTVSIPQLNVRMSLLFVAAMIAGSIGVGTLPSALAMMVAELKKAHAALQAEWTVRHFDQEESILRSIYLRARAATRGLFRLLEGLAALSSNDVGDVVGEAGAIKGKLFPRDLRVLALSAPELYSELDAVVRMIQASFRERIIDLGGTHLITAMEAAHADYGKTLGVTAPLEMPNETKLQDLLRHMMNVAKLYILQIAAWGELHPENRETARRLLHPMHVWIELAKRSQSNAKKAANGGHAPSGNNGTATSNGNNGTRTSNSSNGNGSSVVNTNGNSNGNGSNGGHPQGNGSNVVSTSGNSNGNGSGVVNTNVNSSNVVDPNGSMKVVGPNASNAGGGHVANAARGAPASSGGHASSVVPRTNAGGSTEVGVVSAQASTPALAGSKVEASPAPGAKEGSPHAAGAHDGPNAAPGMKEGEPAVAIPTTGAHDGMNAAPGMEEGGPAVAISTTDAVEVPSLFAEDFAQVIEQASAYLDPGVLEAIRSSFIPSDDSGA